MLSDLFELALLLLSIAGFLAGLAIFSYGMYSFRVSNFDKAVRRLCLFTGGILLVLCSAVLLFN